MPEFKLFTEEPKQKRSRRHKKYAKEARESAFMKKEMEKKAKSTGGLESQIMKRQADRQASANSFFDRLLDKYGGGDDSEEYVFPSKKKSVRKSTTKEPINEVKRGRVSKKK